MKLNDYQMKILKAEVCPYCKGKTKVRSQSYVYGREYNGRKMIVCVDFPKCDSYVGTHEDGKPLGRLAQKKLREAKKNAHFWFDKIWKEKFIERGSLYAKLSDYMDLPSEYTHIGMFSIDSCLKVQEWAKDIYENIKIKD